MNNIKTKRQYKQGDILVCVERFILVTFEHIKLEFNKGDKVKLTEIHSNSYSILLDSKTNSKVNVGFGLLDSNFALV